MLTALQAKTVAAVAADAAAPDLVTFKAAMGADIEHAVGVQLGPLIQRINELEQREAEHCRALSSYVNQLKATMASAAAVTGPTAGSSPTPADPSIRHFKTKLATMEAELHHPQHLDARTNLDPRVILRWLEDEELPKAKRVGIPASNMAFAEVPDDPAPSYVENPTGFNQFWATTGPGAYGHQTNPHLDATSLGDLQRANLCPQWDGRGETVHNYLLKWRRWERSVGHALD